MMELEEYIYISGNITELFSNTRRRTQHTPEQFCQFFFLLFYTNKLLSIEAITSIKSSSEVKLSIQVSDVMAEWRQTRIDYDGLGLRVYVWMVIY